VAGFVDSHAHLTDAAFAAEVDPVIARARAGGALAIVCIGESPDAADRASALATDYPGLVWYTAGVHPHDAARFDAARDLPRLRAHAGAGAAAIGECGLDYHYDHSTPAQQRAAFRAQLELAASTGKPLVVHTRDAVDDTLAMIDEAAAAKVRGVLHCFTGPPRLAERAIGAGWYVSFSGIVTFRKWTENALIRAIPEDRLLVESDAPYLAPEPHRGKRNEPAYVRLTLDRMAEVRGVSAGELGSQTARNAARLFGLALAEVVP
jgi:TatD DNase family protein